VQKKEQETADSKSLGAVIMKNLHSQAEAKNFGFE
jgi:hypothetical protein